MPVKVVTSEVPKDLMASTNDYIPTEIEGYPPRAREYKRRKNEL